MPISQDIASINLQIHACTVEKVYNSGLIDARSDRDKFFEQINSLFFAAEGDYQEGERCIVVSDGSQHYSFGKIEEPKFNDSGEVTVKNIKNDLFDLVNAKALVATDNFGSQSKVSTSPGGGIVLDCGDNAIIHLDPGNNKITTLTDRQETITIPFTAELDHDGVSASSKYKWRTLADTQSWDRDVARDRTDAADLGGILTVDIGPSPDMLTIEYKISGQTQTKIEINTLGEIVAESGAVNGSKTTMKLSPLTGVEIKTAVGQFTMDITGRIKLGNAGVDVIDTLSQTLTTLSTAQTMTALGPQPIIQAPAFLALKLALDTING